MAATVPFTNTSRRDELIAIEKKYQKIWQDEGLFQVDAPSADATAGLSWEEMHEKYPKYFGTMAYPYMNGVLHAGHSFTLSKIEFTAGFERMLGKRALFPLGFHCTGMPIKACADKLVREIEQFGKLFENAPPEDGEEGTPVPEKSAEKSEDVSKFKAKKSKAQAKQGRGKFQFEIMLQLGIPREEVHKFADANYWLTYFPPLCQEDCTNFGARIDWRRSFITTDANPYYDQFVRWQMNRLKALGKIKFGERYTIYSAKDGQPCMDHDRQSGEAVGPQEYTAIKIEVLEFPETAVEVLKQANFSLQGKKVFLVAATLRPETMYGQTCCFVSPKITYGLFNAGNGNYYICTERSFKNMSFQKLTPQRGNWASELDIAGSALIGARIRAPLSVYPEVRVLPMETVLATKGTGVVTCVPSDSPDDYITMKELAHKPEYYGIQAEWAAREPLPIIETPTYGKLTAEKLVQDLKIQSPKDAVLLAKAKELAYKEGYYQGKMIYGPYTGLKVEEAKPKVREDLLKAGDAFVYNEPESQVISRSGDDCVVSLEDQWFTDYGEESWRAQAEECLAGMKTYSPETNNAFEAVLGWLRNWALSRSYGLGTRIPWDPQYLVESLSDSTVYMAYYTVCHLLHSDFYGTEAGPLQIPAEDMVDNAWDYVFHNTDEITCNIPKEKLDKMRQEFEYFYPLDLRVSGKDLIPNHLTFFIYCHVALFPKKFWPRGIRANGHLMLNNQKMSKSTGNFRTLKQITEIFGADASRIALADAGDTFEDANFDESNANAAILRLHNLKEWIEEVVASLDTFRTGEYNFFDRAFENEMSKLTEACFQHYSNAAFKLGLKSGFFEFLSARDYYRDICSAGVGMHRDLLRKYIETQILLLAPIAPHFSEYVYRDLLKLKGSVHDAKFPRAEKPEDPALTAALEYVRSVSKSVREIEGVAFKKQKKGAKVALDPKKPVKLSLYISGQFPAWQARYIDLVRESFDALTMSYDPELPKKVAQHGEVKKAMPFVNFLKQRLRNEKPEIVFNRELIFNEVETTKEALALKVYQRSTTSVKLDSVEAFVLEDETAKKAHNIITGEEVSIESPSKALLDAVPGSPAIVLSNV